MHENRSKKQKAEKASVPKLSAKDLVRKGLNIKKLMPKVVVVDHWALFYTFSSEVSEKPYCFPNT
jgi:hypothetical protein